MFAGTEPPELAASRESSFQTIWQQQEDGFQEIVQRVDDKVLNDMQEFVRSADAPTGRLSTGLMVYGANSNGQKHLVEQLREETEKSVDIIIQLRASQSPNLQSALKHIIRDAIEEHSGQEELTSFLASKKHLIPMSFDLELLQQYLDQKGLGKIIISFPDVETFDTGVLSELLLTLGSWSDRIPFVAFLGIATTIELFESRLPKSVLHLLDITAFDVSSLRDPIYKIFCSVQCDPRTKLCLGASAIHVLHDLTHDQIASTSSFVQALKYIYMTHFFANPLSLLLEIRLPKKEDIVPLCESIRNTPSFQNHCESLLAQGKSRNDTVRQLLNDNAFLLVQAQSAVQAGLDMLRHVNERVQHLVVLNQYFHPRHEPSLQLHAQTLNALPHIKDSSSYEALIERLKAVKSDDLITFISAHPTIIPKITGRTLSQLTTSVMELHTKHMASSICPTYTSQASCAVTKNTTGSPAGKEYTKVIDALLGKLASYFSSTASGAVFIDPSTLFMSEAFLYNARSPLSSIFVPRARSIVERALSRPSDYLGCECCNDPTSWHEEEHGDGREATSVLYNLVNEAGREINVRDLWDTFRHIFSASHKTALNQAQARVRNPVAVATAKRKDSGISKAVPTVNGDADRLAQDSELEEDADVVDEGREVHVLASFYQALANVKMLGLIKSSSAIGPGANRKTVDVVSRTIWKGL